MTFLAPTGHGIKDEDGHLYLTMTNLTMKILNSPECKLRRSRQPWTSAGPRETCSYLIAAMQARSRPAGVRRVTPKFTPSSNYGRGYVVLASSDAIQLSFEGNDLIETVPPSLRSGSTSLFTRYLVEGLRTGEADLDNDGDVARAGRAILVLFMPRVTEERPQQRPTRRKKPRAAFSWPRILTGHYPRASVMLLALRTRLRNLLRLKTSEVCITSATR